MRHAFLLTFVFTFCTEIDDSLCDYQIQRNKEQTIDLVNFDRLKTTVNFDIRHDTLKNVTKGEIYSTN